MPADVPPGHIIKRTVRATWLVLLVMAALLAAVPANQVASADTEPPDPRFHGGWYEWKEAFGEKDMVIKLYFGIRLENNGYGNLYYRVLKNGQQVTPPEEGTFRLHILGPAEGTRVNTGVYINSFFYEHEIGSESLPVYDQTTAYRVDFKVQTPAGADLFREFSAEVGAHGNPVMFNSQNTSFSATNTDNPMQTISNLTGIVLAGLGIVAVAFFIYGCWLYMSSGNESSRAEQGKNSMLGALTGMVMALVAFGIIELVALQMETDTPVPPLPAPQATTP